MSTWLSSRRGAGAALLLGVAVSLGVIGLSQIGAFAGWETRAIDAFLFLRDREPSPQIALVLIDDEAFREMGERQPLSRRYLAELADFLLESGARVVALDILLQTPSEADEDRMLLAVAERWGRAGRLVFGQEVIQQQTPADRRYEFRPHFSPALLGASGFINTPIDVDGLVRRMHPVLPAVRGGLLPSFPLAALAGWAGIEPAVLARTLVAGAEARLLLPVADRAGGIRGVEPVRIGLLERAQWRISFAGPPGTFTSFPAGPLIAMARAGVKADADNPFRDRIVFVGGSFAASRDFYPTPTGLMAGVEIHANAAHTLLARRALLPPPWWLNLAVLLGACLTVALLSLWLHPWWVALASLMLVGAITALSYEAYSQGGYWIDFVAPVAAMLLYQHGARLVARRRLRAAFGQYVSPEVMARVVRQGSDLGGEIRTVSVLVSDLRGFTTLCERFTPEQVTAAMNEYLTAMVERILAHRGMVSDFIGDGILAFYGAPLEDADHAWHAVETALEMQAALEGLNAGWVREGKPSLSMGIAVNTGPAYAGTIGASRKKKYAVLGDTVNTAARIESLNRQLGTRILIGRPTLEAARARVVVKARDRVAVKGKAEPVEVFEVLGLADGAANQPDGVTPVEAKVWR